MKYIFYLFLILFIIFVLLVYKYHSSTNNIGNILCYYFTNIGRSFKNNNNFYKNYYLILKTEEIYNYLPLTIKLDKNLSQQLQILPFDLFKEKNKDKNVELWECLTPDIEKFWFIMKPTIYTIIDNMLSSYIQINKNPKDNIKNIKLENLPIIHYRCADVPFNRHFSYHLQRFSFFLDSIKKLENKGIDCSVVKILSCLLINR